MASCLGEIVECDQEGVILDDAEVRDGEFGQTDCTETSSSLGCMTRIDMGCTLTAQSILDVSSIVTFYSIISTRVGVNSRTFNQEIFRLEK